VSDSGRGASVQILSEEVAPSSTVLLGDLSLQVTPRRLEDHIAKCSSNVLVAVEDSKISFGSPLNLTVSYVLWATTERLIGRRSER
jgi:hypothetical protein